MVRSFFQPIVLMQDFGRIGDEALSRSELIELETPVKILRVEAQRTSATEPSRSCRVEPLRAMERTELLESLIELLAKYPALPFVLEVNESGVTSTDYLREHRQTLDDVTIGLAYDDFGSGQTGLT